MKRVLIVCGSGMVTSTVVAEKVRERCRERGIEIAIDQLKVADLVRGVQGYDLIVATTQVPQGVGIPSISALPLLTGIGAGAVLDKIEAELSK